MAAENNERHKTMKEHDTKTMTLLRKIKSVAIPATSRAPASPSGSYTHWVWLFTGVRRKDPWTPRLFLGVEYSAPAEPMPDDGGACAAGRWATTRPTGHKRLLWD